MRKSLALLTAALVPLGLASAIATAARQAAVGATATYSLTTMKLPNGTTVPLRWNGCQKAITWKVNLAAVPSAQRATVLSETKTAVARVAGSTGFTFSYKGYTTAALRGFVVIDTPQMLAQTTGGFGTGTRRTNLLMHELGHAFGLQHVSTTTQQMYPTLTSRSPSGLASGDRYGLYKSGRAAGCINTAYMPLAD